MVNFSLIEEHPVHPRVDQILGDRVRLSVQMESYNVLFGLLLKVYLRHVLLIESFFGT